MEWVQTDKKDKDSFDELIEGSAFLLSYSSFMYIKAINAYQLYGCIASKIVKSL